VTDIRPDEVLAFWFIETDSKLWFRRDEAFDNEIRSRFGDLHTALSKDVPDSWLATRDGVLAAIIVLDQFSRNLFRGSPRAFAQDTDALNLAHLAIERGWASDYPEHRRAFLYMPFMHAEDRRAQDRSVELFTELGGDHLDFAKLHQGVIARFGRFPGRNKALGRESTAEEQAYLDDGGGF
jgi:uncharacterized protein (DUF924 family)